MLGLGLGLRLGLVLGLFSALLDMLRTRSPMFDRLQRRNNSHGLVYRTTFRARGWVQVRRPIPTHPHATPTSAHA